MDVPTEAAAAAAAAANPSDDLDSPVRILVQTRTHLVPHNRIPESCDRFTPMLSLICQHVWQREFDQFRERDWNYRCHFALDNVECWFLVDHHGPDPSPPPDPPIVWYRWTGTEFVMSHDPPPGIVRRKLRHYPFERVAHHILIKAQENPYRRPPPRAYKSRAEEIRIKRWMLRSTLLGNLGFSEELLRFVRDYPDVAESVRVQVPPESWARLEDRSKRVLPLELEESDPGTGPSD